MLIEIDTSQLQVGMYIHQIDVAWYHHPFWRRRFLLRSHGDIEKLKDSGARRIWIDDVKGLGISDDVEEPDTRPAIESAGKKKAARWGQPISVHKRPVASAPLRDNRPSRLTGKARGEEIRRASSALNQSKKAVMSMFGDARLGKAVNTKGVEKLVTQISRSVNKDASIILNIARLKNKDEYTFLHSVSVCALMINLARHLGLPEQTSKTMGMAGMLHDVGKMAIPFEILNKPARLSDDEMKVVRNHPERGHDMLSSSGINEPTALDVCLHHHEKMDGSGYPNRIKGEDISLASRMAAICDVYDAITSQRAYNEPFPASKALAHMISWKGHFDRLLLKSFIESLGIWPVGECVLLDNEMLAIVVGEDPLDFTKPTVRPFYSVRKAALVESPEIQIAHERGSARIDALADPSEYGIDNWEILSSRLLEGAV